MDYLQINMTYGFQEMHILMRMESLQLTLILKEAVTIYSRFTIVVNGILLLGNESQTVGPEESPMEVHLILLGANIVLLEGVRLAEVSEGVYFLNAVPLNLAGADGSPCRAVLIDCNGCHKE